MKSNLIHLAVSRAAFVGLATALGLGSLRAQAEPLPAEVRAALDAALEVPLAPEYDALYDAATRALGELELVRDELGVAAQAEAVGARTVRAQWILGFLAWRHGQLEDALRHVDAVYAVRGDEVLVAQRRGRLLDALGRTDKAEAAYAAVLEFAELDPELEASTRLRLALQDLSGGDSSDAAASQALLDFARAEGRDPALRNRAANVLALLGRPADAVALYVVADDLEGTRRFRDEVRLATWAVRAEDYEKAQEHAWNARTAAQLRRDRDYALSILVEAYRSAGDLEGLIARFAAAEELDEASREVWVDLLRETGQIDEAVRLFRESRGEFTLDMQRELVEMYREAGQEDRMVATYRELITEDPRRLTWREGLSRFYLERGDVDSAREVWRSYVEDPALRPFLVSAAEAMLQLGIDDLAQAACEVCIESGRDRYPALLLLFDAHRRAGRLPEAEGVLARMDEIAPADATERASLAEAYEQLGRLDRAVEVLEGLRAARAGGHLIEDLEMRLAWLYSETGAEEKALARWEELWRRVQSVARRRFVEDRLMTVASRLGELARIVVDLETKLASGKADEQDSGLLVRLYTKVNDPVSAAEVIDEFFRQSGGSDIDALGEKARVYLACTDYAHYEETLRELIRVDPKGERDYLRNLVMSQLERGRPDEAREALARLRILERGQSDSAEFEAGVLALAGLREEAIKAYRQGLAEHSGRIEIYLLLANLLRDSGATDQAVGMFQYLAETAERDDLFTIAIDGLLNMEARPQVLRWARRVTWERMAGRHDKPYLYQLLADLSEELEERGAMLDALEGSLAIAGERRPNVLRELMDLAKGDRRGRGGDRAKRLSYGRRLVSLSDVVPPQVYLDLGQAFLDNDEIANAVKTFERARDLADFAAFRRQVAELYEGAGYLDQARRTFEAVLLGDPSDVSLLVKVADLEEQRGRDAVAFELYRRAAGLLLDRKPVATTKTVEKDDSNVPVWVRARNVDETQRFLEPVQAGMLVTAESDAAVVAELERQLERVDAAFAELDAAPNVDDVRSLDQSPRIELLASLCRRLAFAVGRPELVHDLDQKLVARFSGDIDPAASLPEFESAELVETLARERMEWGFFAAARAFVEASPVSEAAREQLRFAVGAGGQPPARSIPVAQTARLLLQPAVAGDRERVRMLLQKTGLGNLQESDFEHLPSLATAARFAADEDLAVTLSEAWIRAMFRSGKQSYEVTRVYNQAIKGLSLAAQRRIDEFVLRYAKDNLDKASSFLRMLPTMQKRYEKPLLTPEQVAELLEGSEFRYAYGLGPLLELLPAEDRPSTLRRIWGKIAKTERASFLLQLAGEMQKPMEPALVEFIAGGMAEAVEASDEPFRYLSYSFEEIAQNSANLDLAERVADAVLSVKPEEFAPRCLKAATLLSRGREAEAVEIAVAALRDALGVDEQYEWSNASAQISSKFFPSHFAAFDAIFAELESPTVRDCQRRVVMVRMLEDKEKLLPVLQEVVALHPGDSELARGLYAELRRTGQIAEALAVLEKAAAANPEDDTLKRMLASGYRSLDRDAEALEVLTAMDSEKGGAEPSEQNVGTAAGGASVRKYERPTVAQLKKHVDAEAFEAAQMEYRRLWRSGGGGNLPFGVRIIISHGGIIHRSGGGGGAWPAEPVDDGEAEKRKAERRRGGMARFDERPVEAEERPTVPHVLAGYAFGRDELERQIRGTPIAMLESRRESIAGLRHALVERLGRQGAIAHLRDEISAGRAGRVEFVQFLDLLQEAAEAGEQTPGVDTMIDELVRSVDVVDAQQVRRVAQVFASTGRTDAATRLYRWCALAAVTDPRGTQIFPDLIASARQVLQGDDLVAAVDVILRSAKPDNHWSTETWENLVLETWEEILPPAEALERCREVCDAVGDVSNRLRRNSAKRAASILARAGELDAAIRGLEVGLCTLPTEGIEFEYVWFKSQYERPGFMADDDLRRLFPVEPEGWVDLAGWYARVLESLAAWDAEGRLREGVRETCSALVVVRMFEAGQEQAARTAVAELLAGLDASGADVNTQLWVADAARRVGESEAADALERRLLDEGRLVVARIPEVLRVVATADGPAAALELGARAAEWTNNPELLVTLTELAEQVGDETAAERWRSAARAAEQARTALEERDRAAKERS